MTEKWVTQKGAQKYFQQLYYYGLLVCILWYSAHTTTKPDPASLLATEDMPHSIRMKVKQPETDSDISRTNDTYISSEKSHEDGNIYSTAGFEPATCATPDEFHQ